jgi:protein-S-isoprenylcysteine O-methyltransferase Ste14
MIEPLIVTLTLLTFLVVLVGGEWVLRRRGVDMGGPVPIDGTLYKLGKYSIFIPWAGMILKSWGLPISLIERPGQLTWVSLGLWGLGFVFLFAGRFSLGNCFRIGIPGDKCGLRVRGLYKISRNPMYVGIYATVLAATLSTLNALVAFSGFIVILVHHKIILAEEDYLARTFGRDYEEYCRRVRRYL